MKKLSVLFLIGTVILSFVSCTKFSGDQEIPAYLCVKPWTLTADYDRYGADTEAITDVWVYIDGNVQGCYEIRDKVYPSNNSSSNDSLIDRSVTIPILSKGTHHLTLYPGVKMNGISSTRIQYPFYQPYYIDSHQFVPGKIDTIKPTTEYYSIDEGMLDFKLMEDFNSVAMKFSKVSTSDTTIYRVSCIPGDVNYDSLAWTGNIAKSHYSGKVTLCDTIDYFCLQSEKMTGLPNQGNYILLELDYLCDVEFEVGLFGYTKNGIETFELVNVRKSDKWKKIYINLGPTITDNQTASWWKVFITSSTINGETANFYFDNIKVVYRD